MRARSNCVETENSLDRLQIIPVDKETAPQVKSERHCLVLAMETL